MTRRPRTRTRSRTAPCGSLLCLALAVPGLSQDRPPAPADAGQSATQASDESSPSRRVRAATGLRFAVLESKIRRKAIRTDTPFGFKVRSVDDDSPAARADVKAGWILLKWDGRPIYTVDEVDGWLWETPAGARVEVGYSRRKDVPMWSRKPWESGTVEVEIRRTHPLEERAGIRLFAPGAADERPAEPERRGVRIDSVAADSPASRAGLRSGDRIVEWNGITVESLADLREPFFESLDETTVDVRVSRRADGDREPRSVVRAVQLRWRERGEDRGR